MEVASCHDLISELPQEIKETILSKLPIKYAVRTCMLSRSWRYKWTSMTNILIDDITAYMNMGAVAAKEKAISFMNGFCSMHDGPIHKFIWYTDVKHENLDIVRWFHILCQKDVKELRAGYNRVPACVFSCVKLTLLELFVCVLQPPPPSFEGFSHMKHLVLNCVVISREDMERLISSCPLLENLKLYVPYLENCELHIRAPNLKCLNLDGHFRDICLENTPLLVDLTVVLDRAERLLSNCDCFSSNGTENFLPKLERLRGNNAYFTHCLRAGSGHRKFITYDSVKQIELYSVTLQNPKEVLATLQLIFSAPNLQELYIQFSFMWQLMTDGQFSDGFKNPFFADRTLNRLKLVKIDGGITNPVCLELIKFLLDRSPSLVTMCIECLKCSISRQETIEMSSRLSSLPCASPKASIVFAGKSILRF